MLCPTNMEQAGMAEGQGRLDPSPIRLLVRQSADAQLATHAGERGDQLTNLPTHAGERGDQLTNLPTHAGERGDQLLSQI